MGEIREKQIAWTLLKQTEQKVEKYSVWGIFFLEFC